MLSKLIQIAKQLNNPATRHRDKEFSCSTLSVCAPIPGWNDAGQGEFSAVGFSYGASADGPVQSRAGGPIEDLGEEASSESSGMQQGS